MKDYLHFGFYGFLVPVVSLVLMIPCHMLLFNQVTCLLPQATLGIHSYLFGFLEGQGGILEGLRFLLYFAFWWGVGMFAGLLVKKYRES